MKVKFWGVRGSTPTPEHRNDRYGGNTSCVEIRLDNGTLLVLDCGTGFRALGKSLMREFVRRPIHAHVFLSHFHWDHIQGIPFFAPFYEEGNIFALHSVGRNEAELQGVIEGQLSCPYFPVDASHMKSTRALFNLDYGSINVNGALITSAPLNHPQGCAGYRIDADGATFVFATDNEPGSPRHDQALRDLALGADLLVYDAQFTPEQLQFEKRGWGHGTWQEAARIAKECGVQQLILFHHDPDHDDTFVDGLVSKAREQFPSTRGAAEGMEISLPEREWIQVYEAAKPRHETRYHIEVPVMVAWQGEHGERVQARALARNVSKSGIYFVGPTDIPSEQPVDVELVLPEELTSEGPVKVRFAAQPIRQQKDHPPAGANSRSIGVAALKIGPESTSKRNHRNYHWVA